MLLMLHRLVVCLLLVSTSLTGLGAIYNTDANVGQSASLTASCSGSAPFAYQWYKDSVAISGATSPTYAINSLQLSDTACYTVIISNSAGSAKSSDYKITVSSVAIAPSITTQPLASTISAGSSASMSVAASGTAPLSYQWYRNGVALAGETASSLYLPATTSSDEGSYTVKVSNSAGSISSNAATLSITTATVAPSITSQPASSSVTAGQSASFFVTTSGTAPFTYQWYKDGVAIAGATASSYSLTAASAGNAGAYTVTVSNSAGSITSTAATLSIAAAVVAPSISTQPTSLSVTASQNATFAVAATGTAPLSYQWYKDGVAVSGATSLSLSLSTVATSDAGAYTVKISNAAGSVTSSVANLSVTTQVVTKTASAPVIDIQPAPVGAVAGNSASFSVSVSGTAPFSFQWYKDGANLSGATSSSYSLSAVATGDAGSYTVKVSNSTGSVTSNAAALTVTAAPIAPTITKQPAAYTVAPAQPATFTVEATGTGTLSYQWYKASVPITNATAASFTIAACTTADASTYSVTVYNSVGSVTSKGASLVVDTTLTKPVITSQPVALTVAVGRAASFSVKASSTTTPLYQWKKDGVAIIGATTDTLTIASSQLTDAGSYSVVVSNGAGSVSSSPASLSVAQPAADIIQNRITNMSVRSLYDANSGPMIIGFNVTGGAKDMLIRAIGPALGIFGVSGTLADPSLTLYSGGTEISSNDNWGDDGLADTLSNAFAAVGAFGIFDAAGKDAAMLANVDGARTVHVKSPQAGASGVVLLEVYDTGSGTAQRLNNLSIMNSAGSGSKCLIVGFTIDGTGTKRVLIRGVGPGLTPFGVQGVLADPKLELHGSVNGVDTILASNDSWQDDPNAASAFTSAGAFALPAGSKDTALVIELPAGAYTAMLSGADSATGTALVEVYELP